MMPRREAVSQAEGEPTSGIRIDTQAIPAPVRDTLAAATMDLLNGILSQPGGREMLEAKKVALGLKR